MIRLSNYSFLLHWLALVAIALASSFHVHAAAFHSVYYHRLQGSFWAQLADDICQQNGVN